LRPLCGLLAVGSCAFAAYISLVPFNFEPLSRPELFDALRAALDQGITSTANFLANIVLFLPVGFFVGCACWHGTARRKGLSSAGVLVAALLVSVVIEALQVFVPGRTPAISDVGALARPDLLQASRRIPHSDCS
jgi:VanZ family protein